MTILKFRTLHPQVLALALALFFVFGCDAESTDAPADEGVPNETEDAATPMETDTMEEGEDALAEEDVNEAEESDDTEEPTEDTSIVEEEPDPFPQAAWCSKVGNSQPEAGCA